MPWRATAHSFQEKVAAVRLQRILQFSARWRVFSRRRTLTKLGHGTAPGPLRNLQKFPTPIGLQKFLKSVAGIPGSNRAPEIPEILLRSSALSQAYLRQTILGSMDTAQKLHAMLLEIFCKFKTAHRCNLFARQLFFFKLAKSLPHPPRFE